jgi:transcriptional regulator with XRE-family HTH domain
MNMHSATQGACVTLPRGVNVISSYQTKAARAVLGLSMNKLAAEVGISESSIRRIENDLDITVDMMLRLQTFFEHKGFTFLWDGDEDGLKWRRPSSLGL